MSHKNWIMRSHISYRMIIYEAWSRFTRKVVIVMIGGFILKI